MRIPWWTRHTTRCRPRGSNISSRRCCAGRPVDRSATRAAAWRSPIAIWRSLPASGKRSWTTCRRPWTSSPSRRWSRLRSRLWSRAPTRQSSFPARTGSSHPRSLPAQRRHDPRLPELRDLVPRLRRPQVPRGTCGAEISAWPFSSPRCLPAGRDKRKLGTPCRRCVLAAKRVERRLAAILAADVAGYSRLTGLDEEGTHAQLQDHLRLLVDPKISEHRGRIVKNTGDGMLAEFSSVVDAVRCAVDVQCGMAERNADVPHEQRIEFRIGINVGDIMIDRGDIFGDGVNVAVRLEGLAEPGGICLSDDAQRQVRGKLELTSEDMGEQKLKNIAQPVRVYRVRPSRAAASSRPALPLPDKPSIAVLPFQNMSADPAQDYFSDGISEDIITELSRFRSLFVVARNSSFSLRGNVVNVTEVGRQLGVRYVVEGSVRKAGKRVRVTIQLLDAASGNHLWGERYDRELEDIFIVQDEITRTVVSTLPGRLEDAGRDLVKRKQTSNITAYDLVLLGNERWRRLTRKDLAEALGYFRSAVALVPNYARAHANIAWIHVCQVFLETGDATSLDDGLRHIQTALDIDESDAWSHGVFAQLL